MLQLQNIHYRISIVCIHSDPHPLGPIIGLASCFGLYFAITVAISTVLLVLHVKYFKKWRNEKGKYI